MCPWPPDKKPKKLNNYSKYLFTSGSRNTLPTWEQMLWWGWGGRSVGEECNQGRRLCPLMKAPGASNGQAPGSPCPQRSLGSGCWGNRKHPHWPLPGLFLRRTYSSPEDGVPAVTWWPGSGRLWVSPGPPCCVGCACLTRQSCVDCADQPVSRDDCQGTVSGQWLVKHPGALFHVCSLIHSFRPPSTYRSLVRNLIP